MAEFHGTRKYRCMKIGLSPPSGIFFSFSSPMPPVDLSRRGLSTKAKRRFCGHTISLARFNKGNLNLVKSFNQPF